MLHFRFHSQTPNILAWRAVGMDGAECSVRAIPGALIVAAGLVRTAEAQAITAGGLDNQTLGKIAISHENCDVSKQGQLVVGG